MCRYCEAEGCYCGRQEEGREVEPCQNLTLGSSTCASCGCTAAPWWNDVELPGDNGEARDLLHDLQSGGGSFPLTKDKVIQMGQSSPQAVSYLLANLPEGTYNGTSEIVAALIRNSKPMSWDRKPTDIISKYQVSAIVPGRKLVVGEDQRCVLMSVDGKACDEFGPGEQTISRANSPKLASLSRKVAPGFRYDVLDGFPVYASTSMEFEIEVTEAGQTKALRRVVARGVARASVSSAGTFAEKLGTKANFNSQNVLSELKKLCSEALRNEMSLHEMDELTSNHEILEKVIASQLGAAGLRVVTVNLGYVGELGPGAFGMAMPGQGGRPQNMEQMKQWADAMKAQQMEMMQKVQEMQKMRAASLAAAQAQPNAQTAVCASCNAPNPPMSKFCNNCGKPLQQAGKVCQKCGQKVEAGVKFCGNCGSRVE